MAGFGIRSVWLMMTVAIAATTNRATACPRPGKGLSSSRINWPKSTSSEKNAGAASGNAARSWDATASLDGSMAGDRDDGRGACAHTFVGLGRFQANANREALGQAD